MAVSKHEYISRESRERERGELASKVEKLLAQIRSMSAGERLEWYRRHRGEFFFDKDAPGSIIAELNKHHADRKAKILEWAQDPLNHVFNLLGSGRTQLDKKINWNLDFISGFEWRGDVQYPTWNWRRVDRQDESQIYKGPYYILDDNSDLKIPWDLANLLHFPLLGEAYWQSGDEAFSDELMAQAEDWLNDNPCPKGISWTCAMMVGIRLANLLFGLKQLEALEKVEKWLAEKGVEAALVHVLFILENLEVDEDGRRNNHYAHNVLGLTFAGALFGKDECGKALLDFAHTEALNELSIEISLDGTNFEGTIPYHRFAVESLLVAIILLDCNSRKLDAHAVHQLRNAMIFMSTYTKPNNLAPQIGDNDNGRILVLDHFGDQEYRDHRHLLNLGAQYLDIPARYLCSETEHFSPDALWLLNGSKPQQSVGKLPVHPCLSVHLKNGYVISKSHESYLIMRCGNIDPISSGGHNHSDQLSMEYCDLKTDLIVDPGAYIYSGNVPERHFFRSTAAHNTLQLEDYELQEFQELDLFAMSEKAYGTLDLARLINDIAMIEGHHHAYGEHGWMVHRALEHDHANGELRIFDRIYNQKRTVPTGRFTGRFYLGIGVEAEQISADTCELRCGNKKWLLTVPPNVSAKIKDAWVSTGYGVRFETKAIEYVFESAVDFETEFRLVRA